LNKKCNSSIYAVVTLYLMHNKLIGGKLVFCYLQTLVCGCLMHSSYFRIRFHFD